LKIEEFLDLSGGLLLISFIFLLSSLAHFASPSTAWIGWWELAYFGAFASVGIAFFFQTDGDKLWGVTVFALLAILPILVNEVAGLVTGAGLGNATAALSLIFTLGTFIDEYLKISPEMETDFDPLMFGLFGMLLWSFMYFAIRLSHAMPLPSFTVAYHASVIILMAVGIYDVGFKHSKEEGGMLGKVCFALSVLVVLTMLWHVSMGWGLQFLNV